LTAVTSIVNVCGALVFTPPLATPPLSLMLTETVAFPFAFGAGVKASLPAAFTAGCPENRVVLSFVTRKLSVCVDSFAGPLLRLVAHPTTKRCPESSFTI
jgi:hypothetical protein